MAKTIKGINVVIGAETTGLQKALSDVNKKSKDIQKELREVNRALKLDPKNTELLRQKKELLSQAVVNTREKLEQLKSVQEQVNEQFAKGEISDRAYREFNREIAKTEERLRYLQEELKKTGIDFEKMGKSVQEAGKNISDVGTKLTKGVTVPLVTTGGLAVKAASDFESAFAGVRKTVDATEEEFAYFRQEILNMSKEMPQAATEIARVAEAAGQLGIQNDAILGFTKTMVDMGVATNMSSEDAAMALARLATITQMNQQDFDRLGATIVGLGNNLAATESEIVEMGLRLAGAGSTIGMTEAQILSFAGSLAAVGINAEAGGSAFSKLMIEIANEVATGGEKLEDFAQVAGMTVSNFKQAFQDDAAGAIVSFVEGLGRMQESGQNVFGTLEDLGLTEVRLRDALLRAAGAGDLFRESLELGNKAWEENTALTDEAAQRYETFESQLQIFWNNLKAIAITLGEALIPALLDAMKAAQPLIDMLTILAYKFSAMDPEMQRMIITIAALVAALGPVLVVVGKVVSAIGTLIISFGKVKAFLITLKPLFVAAGTAIGSITLPVAATIAAITALIAAGVLLWKNWDKVKEFAANLWKNVTQSFENMKNAVSEKMSAAWQSIKDRWDAITDFFKGINLMDIGKDIIQGLIDGIQDKFNALKDKMRDIGDSIKDTIANVLGIRSPSRVMIGFGENIGEGMAIGIERASSMVQEMSQRMANMAVPDVSGLTGQATSNNTTNNQVSNVFHVTVQADDLRQVGDVVRLFQNLQQVSRQGV